MAFPTYALSFYTIWEIAFSILTNLTGAVDDAVGLGGMSYVVLSEEQTHQLSPSTHVRDAPSSPLFLYQTARSRSSIHYDSSMLQTHSRYVVQQGAQSK